MSRISPLVLKKIHLPLDLQSTGTEEYTIAVIFAVNQPPPSRPARPPPGPRFFVRFAVAVAARISFSAAIVLRSRSRSFFFFIVFFFRVFFSVLRLFSQCTSPRNGYSFVDPYFVALFVWLFAVFWWKDLSLAAREEKVFSLLNFIAAALSARVRALFSGFQLFWLLVLLLLLECHRVGSLFEFQVGPPLFSASFFSPQLLVRSYFLRLVFCCISPVRSCQEVSLLEFFAWLLS